MQDSNMMGKEAKSLVPEQQEQAKKAAQRYQEGVETGFEVASRSFEEMNKGMQAVAAEITNHSKRTLEDIVSAWEELLQAKSFSDVVDIQTTYARKAYDTYMSGFAKFGQIYLSTAQTATKPVEQATRSVK
jgi:hypothetical protein